MALITDILLPPDVASNRPSAGQAGRLYFSTDTGVLQRDNGSSWDTYAPGGGLTSPVSIANGGTGQTTKAPAFDAISPMSASGDIIYGGASGTGTRLAKGSDTQVLTLAAGVPSWASPSSGTNDVAHGATGAISFTAASLIGSDGSSSTGALRPLAVGTGLNLTGSTLTASASGGTGSSLVLLQHLTASGSATLDFTGSFSSTYDVYKIEIVELVPATNNVDIILRYSVNAGSTWDATAGHYSWANARSAAPSAIGGNGNGSDTALCLSLGLSVLSNTAAEGGLSGSYTIYNPLGSASYTRITGLGGGAATSGFNDVPISMGGSYRVLAAVNAFRVLANSGNLTSGDIFVYGVVKA